MRSLSDLYSFLPDNVQASAFAERSKGIKNKQLLWHGSRLSNWTGILSQGLRIAPPEAPATGYMVWPPALAHSSVSCWDMMFLEERGMFFLCSL